MNRDPGHENRERAKNYFAEVRCNNCGERQDISVPKGTRVDQVLKDFECQNCKCAGTLEKC
jgi:hypothetical protein